MTQRNPDAITNGRNRVQGALYAIVAEVGPEVLAQGSRLRNLLADKLGADGKAVRPFVDSLTATLAASSVEDTVQWHLPLATASRQLSTRHNLTTEDATWIVETMRSVGRPPIDSEPTRLPGSSHMQRSDLEATRLPSPDRVPPSSEPASTRTTSTRLRLRGHTAVSVGLGALLLLAAAIPQLVTNSIRDEANRLETQIEAAQGTPDSGAGGPNVSIVELRQEQDELVVDLSELEAELDAASDLRASFQSAFPLIISEIPQAAPKDGAWQVALTMFEGEQGCVGMSDCSASPREISDTWTIAAVDTDTLEVHVGSCEVDITLSRDSEANFSGSGPTGNGCGFACDDVESTNDQLSLTLIASAIAPSLDGTFETVGYTGSYTESVPADNCTAATLSYALTATVP